ncbi:DNA (cytosine-5)-methyltransferase 1 [Psychrobacillus psychrotolerans]|uniref:DNA (cytosine-5-)-methyltransferase n=1 Tax=Psychrobacillus psychrotolerans TaxID=126156 RepID=A0A1I5XZT9_9BACI|nr:DNA cytosine methyltransferase [Psychrobacillus psychrotolerans]SFQ37436.1 DNA (cytosine-5)-methyltransferase 1 [Psychrobacillus psychrotolerans]
MNKNAVCLFSSAGLGELGLKSNNIETVISNEILENRHQLYQRNYPNTKLFTGDIWRYKDEIIEYYKKNYKEDLFLLYATPPCQGMSSNGAGKLLSEIRKGNRPQIDERNRLIIPTLDIIEALQPEWIILENVPNMQHTVIKDEFNNYINIMDYIDRRLGHIYKGSYQVISCSDYGVPQLRKRLLTVYTRNSAGIEYFNQKANFFLEEEKTEIKTLRDAIGNLPPLDAKKGLNTRYDFHPLHYVSVMNEEKYWWVSHTKEGEQAYNNQCVNIDCLDSTNPLHKDVIINGIAQSNKTTPIYCQSCGSLLPRPSIIDKITGERRLIKGFHSAYRRMEWDKPAAALTKNFPFEASDKKIHPTQNRVLSIYEALIIQSISEYDYNFKTDEKYISKTLLAEIIGESVPPKIIDFMCAKILSIHNRTYQSNSPIQLSLEL